MKIKFSWEYIEDGFTTSDLVDHISQNGEPQISEDAIEAQLPDSFRAKHAMPWIKAELQLNTETGEIEVLGLTHG